MYNRKNLHTRGTSDNSNEHSDIYSALHRLKGKKTESRQIQSNKITRAKICNGERGNRGESENKAYFRSETNIQSGGFYTTFT